MEPLPVKLIAHSLHYSLVKRSGQAAVYAERPAPGTYARRYAVFRIQKTVDGDEKWPKRPRVFQRYEDAENYYMSISGLKYHG